MAWMTSLQAGASVLTSKSVMASKMFGKKVLEHFLPDFGPPAVFMANSFGNHSDQMRLCLLSAVPLQCNSLRQN